MIEVLTAVVVVLAVATAFNLLLLFAVVRRLRDRPAAAAPVDTGLPAIGTRVGEFAAADLAGDSVGLPGGPVLTGFFSATCEPCQAVVRRLIDRGVQQVPQLLFVVGEADDETTLAFAARLAAVARVAVIPHDDPVAGAFGGISAFPTLLRLDDGVVRAAGNGLAELERQLVPAG